MQRNKPKLSGDLSIEGGVSPRKIVTLNDEGNLVEEEVNIGTASALFNANLLVPFGNGFYMRPEVAASVFGVKVKDFEEVQGGLSKYGLTLGKEFSSGNLEASLEQRPGMGGADDETIGMLQGKFRFNEGGTVPMQQQMEMFDLGGLKDEGGTKDPVSGNDVPTGSLKEEVRDDIDAKLSPGEFVFPADVTRFLGLRFLMKLRDEAKAGLQRMEDMGQMGNSDEAVLDEDVPFEPSDLIIVGGTMTDEKDDDKKMNVGGVVESTNEALFQKRYFDPDNPSDTRLIAVFNDVPVTPIPQGFIEDTPENRQNAEQRKTEESTSAMLQKMAKGGMPVKLQTGGDLSDFANVPASGRFEQLVGQPQFNYEVKEFRNAQGNQLFIPFFRGVPSYQPPPGYTEVTPEQQQEAGAQPEKPAETTTLKKDRSSMDPDISARGFSDMSPLEQAQYGQNISTGFGKVASDVVGTAMTIGEMMLGPPLGAKAGAKALGIELPDFSFGKEADDKKAKEMAAKMANNPAAFAQEMAAYDAKMDTAITDAEKALGATYGADIAKETVSRAAGVTKAQVIAHAGNVASGNAPPGSTANAFGGYSTGVKGFDTNKDDDVVSPDAKDVSDRAKDLGVDLSSILGQDVVTNISYGFTKDIERANRELDRVEREIKGIGEELDIGVATDKELGVGAELDIGADPPDAPPSVSEVEQQESQFGGPSAGPPSGPPSGATGTGPDGNPTGGAGSETFTAVGGFIPKKKKQKKKKRSGLASR